MFGALLVNGWGFPDSQGWNLPSWSVGSEWFAYLCFPFIALGLRHLRGARDFAALAAAIFGVCLLLAWVVNGGRLYMLPESFTLVRVVSEFAIGCCAYGMFVALSGRRMLSWLAAGAIGLSLLLAASEHGPLLDGIFIPLFAVTVLGLANGVVGPTAYLASPLFMYLGRISYSVYLMHGLVIVAFRQLMPSLGSLGLMSSAGVAMVCLLAVVAAGAVLHGLVEDPMRHYLRRVWIAKRRTRVAVNAEPIVG